MSGAGDLVAGAEEHVSGTEALVTGYLRRLGVTARPAPDLDSLSDLMMRHMLRVPFENLDVMARTAQDLRTDTTVRKVVAECRGGFCYELNEAFRWLLQQLGFAVRRIEARVWQAQWQRFGAPFDHLALVVSLAEGEYLVDVGYGDSNRTPLRLPEDRSHDISGEYRLTTAREGFLVLSSQVQPLYEMTVTEQPLSAFAPMCRYHQTSSESIFSKGLICTRATDSGRVTLSKNRLIIVDAGQRTESIESNIAGALTEHFGIKQAATFGEG